MAAVSRNPPGLSNAEAGMSGSAQGCGVLILTRCLSWAPPRGQAIGCSPLSRQTQTSFRRLPEATLTRRLSFGSAGLSFRKAY